MTLQRFLDAQGHSYAQAEVELAAARKQGHWMWFVFPQIAGLGQSVNSRYYAIVSRQEAVGYLQHPVLGARLRRCVGILNGLQGVSAVEVFGSVDAMKLRSCLTLFAEVDGASVFQTALEKYFGGERDGLTLARI